MFKTLDCRNALVAITSTDVPVCSDLAERASSEGMWTPRFSPRPRYVICVEGRWQSSVPVSSPTWVSSGFTVTTRVLLLWMLLLERWDSIHMAKIHSDNASPHAGWMRIFLIPAFNGLGKYLGGGSCFLLFFLLEITNVPSLTNRLSNTAWEWNVLWDNLSPFSFCYFTLRLFWHMLWIRAQLSFFFAVISFLAIKMINLLVNDTAQFLILTYSPSSDLFAAEKEFSSL